MSLKDKMSKSKYERITRYLEQFHRETFGKWVRVIAEGTDENTYSRPYFKYDDDVEEFINDMHEINAVDFDYVKNIEKIEDKAVEDLTEDELITKLTLFVRGEKFCEGMLSVALRDGTIQKILERLKRF